MIDLRNFDKLVMQHGNATCCQNSDFNSHSSTNIWILTSVIQPKFWL